MMPNEDQNQNQGARTPTATPRSVRERLHASRLANSEDGEQTGGNPDSPPEDQNSPQPDPQRQAEPQRQTPQEPETPSDIPDSLTGQESDEKLKELGYNKPATRERFRKLARERNEGMQKAAQEEAKNRQLLEQLEQLQAQLQASKGPEQNALPQDAWEFKEEFPEEGTRDEQERWRVRKEAWDIGTQQARKVAEGLVNEIAPLKSWMSRQLVNQEWDQLEPLMANHNTSREELEPVVHAIWKQDPNRNFRGVVYDAMAQTGVLDGGGEQYVPNSQKPGGGRQSQPREQPEPTDADLTREAFRRAREAGEKGTPSDARRAAADAIGRIVQKPQ